MQPAVVLFFGSVAIVAVVWFVYWLVTKYAPKPKVNNNNGGDNNNGGNNNNGGDNNGGDNNNGASNGSACPDVSDNVLPACEMERRRDEGDRSYCPRGVCGEGLVAVPDFKTAYMICVPEGKGVEEACP